MTPLIRDMVRYAPEPEQYMWFDVGALPMHADRRTLDADVLTHPPFPKTAVVATDAHGVKIVLALIGGNNSVAVSGIGINPDGSTKALEPYALVKTEDGGVHIVPPKGSETQPRERYAVVIRIVSTCMDLLNAQGQAYRPEAKTGHTNRKRAAKGKPPLFDWHTVKIEHKAAQSQRLGGTHASPRLHDRRGHWRTYANGKRGWVKPCKVGDPSKGVVFKDYEVRT